MASDRENGAAASVAADSAAESAATAAAAAAARVEGWVAAARVEHAAGHPDLLEGARSDAEGFAFARRLLEVVAAPNDPFTAALSLRAASHDLPDSLPTRDRVAVRAGGLASLGLPWAVLPVARRWLRERVSHLVVSGRLTEAHGEGESASIREALLAHAEAGMQTVVQLSGEPVLGPEGVAREVNRLIALARQSGVTHLAVDPARVAPASATAAGTAAEWSLDADAIAAAETLAPLYAAASEYGTAILLVPSDYRGALLAPEIIERLLDLQDRVSAPDDGDPPVPRAVHAAPAQYAPIGMHLPAELPESNTIAERLIARAEAHVAAGGQPLELTVGVVGLTGREQIASLIDGLPVPVIDDREAVAAQLLRLSERLLAASATTGAVRVTAENEDPLLLAAVSLVAERHRVPVTLQLRAGTAPVLAAAMVEHGISVRVRQPVVASREFAGALDFLICIAAEATQADGALARAAAFTAAVARADDDALAAASAVDTQAPLTAARDELVRVLARLHDAPEPAHRTQLRGREWHPGERESAAFYRPPTDTERLDTGGLTAAVLGLGRDATGHIVLDDDVPARRVPVISESGFANEPDTDASRLENREWARVLLQRAADARAADARAHGLDGASSAAAHDAGFRGADPEDRDALIEPVALAAEAWNAQRAATRATRVSRLALATASARDRLIEELAVESGAPIAVLDADVSGAVDAARYLGQLAAGLGAVRGAEFVAGRVALVVADAGVPLAERAEAVIAALAAGSAVLLVAHSSVVRSSAALIEEWQAAGLPDDTVQLAVARQVAVPRDPLPDGSGEAGAAGDPAPATSPTQHMQLAASLAADPRISRAIVLGGRDTARALIRRRPELPVEGRFRALGSVAITPSADPAAAVRDAVRSAFGAGAADVRTARALVLLGSAGRSKRLRLQLADAVRGLRVGDSAAPGAHDPLSFDVGPLPAAPDAAGIRALTELQPGEAWLVAPEQLSDDGRLWRPGVRVGVRRGAQFWRDAIGMPVIGVSAVGALDQAIALQSEAGGGGAAALFATDPGDVLPWLDGVSAASLAVGCATTSARVERRPSGGWGDANMGASALAGGPNRLVTLGSWRLREGTASATLHLRGLSPEVQALVETAQASLDYASFDRVRRAALADALTWRASLGRVRDPIGLGVECNLLRHWPVSAHVRLAEDGEHADLVRVLAAALLVRAPLTVSTGVVLPPELSAFLAAQGIAVSLERDDAWLERIAVAGSGESPIQGVLAERVRLIGGDAVRAAEWLGGQDRVPLWAEPITMAGPVELLTFVREQSVTISAHRFGLAAPLAGVEEWIAELDARVSRGA